MVKRIPTFILLALASSTSVVHSESSSGTGSPTVQLVVTENQRVLMQISEGEATIVGSATLQQGYGELILDAFESQQDQLQAGWGRAEILFGCYQADVAVYQNIQGEWQEHAVGTIAVDTCVE